MGFPRQEDWMGCHALLQGNLPDPGIEPESLTSSALAGGFFTTSATWGAPMTCWTDLNAHTEALHATQGPVHYSDFGYTEDHQRKSTGFSSFTG